MRRSEHRKNFAKQVIFCIKISRERHFEKTEVYSVLIYLHVCGVHNNLSHSVSLSVLNSFVHLFFHLNFQLNYFSQNYFTDINKWAVLLQLLSSTGRSWSQCNAVTYHCLVYASSAGDISSPSNLVDICV